MNNSDARIDRLVKQMALPGREDVARRPLQTSLRPPIADGLATAMRHADC